MKFLHSDKAPAAIGPYSQATSANKTIYVSGQLPIVDGELQTDIRKATKASLDNILHIIETEGGKVENIARVGVFMQDLSQFSDMNEVYAEFFWRSQTSKKCSSSCSSSKRSYNRNRSNCWIRLRIFPLSNFYSEDFFV